MTIKDLKKLIENLPDNMKVGGSGHYGEFLDCYGASVSSVSKYAFSMSKATDENEDIFLIEIESAGEEPD